MSICDDNTNKIYSDLNPTASSQLQVNQQNYRLAKISHVEAYFLDEIAKREKLAKK